MNLTQLRERMDTIDDALVDLFTQRMDLSAEIALHKKAASLPIHDPAREREKIYDVTGKADANRAAYLRALYYLMFELSRADQEQILKPDFPLGDKITGAIHDTAWLFPERTVVACQGTEGAYSQLATEKLFALPSIMYFQNFESVFSAVDSGLCAVGVLPLENSTAGSINQVYDLLMRYPFSILRSVRLKIDHCLLAKDGATLSDITALYTHEQAAIQCAAYIKSLGAKVTIVENTAVAAKMVAESGRGDAAALSSRHCASLYGLSPLADAVQDRTNNYTRFICVSKTLAIYPGANITSLMLTLPHKPGSLYHILSRLYIHGINLIKLESRPIPNRDFEFMFYFDLETPIYSTALLAALRELSDLCDELYYLGSYSQI